MIPMAPTILNALKDHNRAMLVKDVYALFFYEDKIPFQGKYTVKKAILYLVKRNKVYLSSKEAGDWSDRWIVLHKWLTPKNKIKKQYRCNP